MKRKRPRRSSCPVFNNQRAREIIAVLSFPLVLLLTRWFRGGAERAYRATREAIALVIVHFTESLGGIRAVQTFRREPRNQAICCTASDCCQL